MAFINNKEKPYDCKILETYFEDSGYKVSAKYKAVVYLIDLKKTTSIELTPEGYYNATNYKQTGEIIGYYFSAREIDKIQKGRDYHEWPFMIFTGSLVVFAFLSLIYLLEYHSDQ